MIKREELLDFAREFLLEANVVEKDYALGWLNTGRLMGDRFCYWK